MSSLVDWQLTSLQVQVSALIAALAVTFGDASPTLAQDQFVMPDRTSDAVFRVRDLDHNGVIAVPGEVLLFFSAANAAGTITTQNATTQAVSACREVAIGDQIAGAVILLKDANNDGDAEDLGESIIFAGPGNAAGISLAFPTGAAFDPSCRLHVVNAGNASGADGIYRLVDLNDDGDAMDKGEITPYVTDGPSGMGAGNGPFSPQEIFFDASGVGYLHNSSINLHGIYRFEDLDSSGRADDAGEFTVYFNDANASGVVIGAGFALEPDRARPGAMYFHHLSGGDTLVRVTDLNNDLDAQDAGEAVVVYLNAAAGFTSVDVVSLPDGDVLITDNSGITVVRLHDGNADGDFLDAGESTIMIAGAGTMLQARQMDALPRTGDAINDGFVNVSDLLHVIVTWGASGTCTTADLNGDGEVDVTDLLLVITNWD